MACYRDSSGNISCTFQPHQQRRIHSVRRTATMDYLIPDHDSTLDSIDRREQEREPEVDDADDEDTWEDDDDAED